MPLQKERHGYLIMALLSPFGQQRCYSRACNPEPLCDLLVRESDYCQFGGTFTALLTRSLLLLSCLSDYT